MNPTPTRSGPLHAIACVFLTYFALAAFFGLFVGRGVMALAQQPFRLAHAGIRQIVGRAITPPKPGSPG